jgi:hypothetical protein
VPDLLIKHKQDTVFLLHNGDIKKIFTDLNRTMGDVNKGLNKTRVQGFGGAGGPIPAMLMIKMKPVALVIGREQGLSDKKFTIDWGWDPFFMMGGMGYGGLGHGVRIGGGGWGGSNRYVSERFGPNRDSTIQLDVHVGYGGFIIEKAFVKDRMNYMFGTLMGGGSIRISKRVLDNSESSAFIDFEGEEKPETAEAKCFVLQAYGGGTYTTLPWFHIGLDGNCALFLSSDGFYSSQGFATLNPGIRLRIIFGNIG